MEEATRSHGRIHSGMGLSNMRWGLLRSKCMAALIVFIGINAYMGSYLWRSSRGRFETLSIGLNGVKNYGWAPRGFVEKFRWNQSLVIAYYPLWFLDNRFWHESLDADLGRYPINEVSPGEIGKLYEAWKQR